MARGRGRSRARADNWCGDGRHRHSPAPGGCWGGRYSPPPPVRGWLFEQVEGISNTVNTGALDKNRPHFSVVGWSRSRSARSDTRRRQRGQTTAVHMGRAWLNGTSCSRSTSSAEVVPPKQSGSSSQINPVSAAAWLLRCQKKKKKNH